MGVGFFFVEWCLPWFVFKADHTSSQKSSENIEDLPHSAHLLDYLNFLSILFMFECLFIQKKKKKKQAWFIVFMRVTLFFRFGDALQPLRLFQVVLFGPNHQVQGQGGEFQKGEETYHSMYNSVHLEF